MIFLFLLPLFIFSWRFLRAVWPDDDVVVDDLEVSESDLSAVDDDVFSSSVLVVDVELEQEDGSSGLDGSKCSLGFC